MSNELVNIPTSAEEMYRYFNAKDGRGIKNNQILEVFSMIPQLQPEVAKEVLEQFPLMVDATKECLLNIRFLFEASNEKSKASFNETKEATLETIKQLLCMLENPNLDIELSKLIIESVNHLHDELTKMQMHSEEEDTKKLYIGLGATAGVLGALITFFNNKKMQSTIKQIPKLIKK